MEPDLRLERIAQRIDALRTYDAGRVVFGAAASGGWGHDYAPGKPITADAIEAFEREHGVMLPATFRALLERLGDGGVGPYYGRLPLAPLAVGEMPRHEVEVSLDGEVVGRAATGPREVPSVASAISRPFPLTVGWRPDQGALPVPAGANPYDGCVKLAEQGCGMFDFLVVNGPCRGEVWSDFTAEEGPIERAHPDVLDWYDAWLDRAELEWLEKNAVDLALSHPEPHRGVAAYAPRLEAVLASGSPSADGWRALGYIRVHLRRLPEALDAFERAATLGKEEPAARLHLDRARVAQARGRHEDALAEIEAGLGEVKIWASTRTELRIARLGSLDALGRAVEALEALRALADNAFWTLDHHYELARRFLRTGDPAAALAALEDAVTRNVGPQRGIGPSITRAEVIEGMSAFLAGPGGDPEALAAWEERR